MQKKFLALAVAGALAPAAAMAQVEIYGRANVGFDTYRATGASADAGNLASRQRVFDSGSRIGFRVNEQLGGGMRAFAVVESGVSIDSGNNNTQGGATNTSAGFWASRDSYAGIGGGWGDVRFGRQSIFFGNGIIAQSGANYINTDVPYWSQGTGVIPIPTARTSNTVSYNSPTVGGFNASVYYSPNGQEALPAGQTGAKDKLWAVTARYTGTPIRAQVDWVRNNDRGNVSNAKRDGIKLGLGYAYAPGSQIALQWMRLGCENACATGALPAGTTETKQRVVGINWEHMIGPWQLLAQYARAGNAQSLSDTGGNAVLVGAKYHLSKRTGVYASFNRVTNKSNAFADYGVGGGLSAASTGALTTTNRGADPRIVAVGVMHNF